jgi:hypothetical protein
MKTAHPASLLHRARRAAAAGAALLAALLPAGAAADEIAAWSGRGFNANDRGWKLDDTKGAFDVASGDATGVKPGDGPEKVGGAGAIVFDGSQSGPGRSSQTLPPLASVKLVLKARADGGAGSQTLFKAGRLFELRYDAEKSRFEWITWWGPENNNYTQATVKAEPSEWHLLVAEIASGKISLKVGDAHDEKKIEGPVLDSAEAAKVFVGANGSRENAGIYRPFTGAMADITLEGELR